MGEDTKEMPNQMIEFQILIYTEKTIIIMIKSNIKIKVEPEIANKLAMFKESHNNLLKQICMEIVRMLIIIIDKIEQ